VASIAELPTEKNRKLNHSLNHSQSLFDAPGTEEQYMVVSVERRHCALQCQSHSAAANNQCVI